MKLRDVCEKTGISKRNIHYYVKEELLSPKQDDGNGYYEFTEEDCSRLLLIRALRNAGFSISQIRSVLNKPSTSGYYLNLRLKELKAEIAHSGAIIEALSYVQAHLPLHVGYERFETLVMESGIPMREDYRDTAALVFEEYDNDLVNRYLWGYFLPDTPMSDYQEYLWSKVVRYSNGKHARDYQILSQSLHRFTGEEIERSFAGSRELHDEVIRLTPEEYDAYSRTMIRNIDRFLERPDLVSSWRCKYLSVTAPSVRLYDSEIAATMAELSPLFRSYRDNIHVVCRLTYDRVVSDEGKPLLEKMKQSLGPCFDIDHCSHGELQSMAIQCRR